MLVQIKQRSGTCFNLRCVVLMAGLEEGPI